MISILIGILIGVWCVIGAICSFGIILSGNDRNLWMLLLCGPVGWVFLIWLIFARN